jgi:predicted nucleotidyltransferase
MLRKHDYELYIDINKENNYDLNNNIHPYLKPKELLLIEKVLKIQGDKIHRLLIEKDNIVKK